MGETKFSVTWNAYQKNICNGLSFLQQRGEFVDMTIAADGHLVKVHQMVMSLVSSYIKELITSAECPQPVIFLNNVSYQTLQFILEYAYTGEVLVPRQGLEQFLQVCNALHIKGLEELGKTITDSNTHGSCQVEEVNKPFVKKSATIDLSHISFGADGDVCTDTENYDDNVTSDHDMPITGTENSRKEDRIFKDSIPKIEQSESKLQYSVSAQGSPQLILNRYIYLYRYTRKDKSKTWRCFHYKSKGCTAAVVTKGEKAILRTGAHNHEFHDAQILKRMRSKGVFTVEPKEHEWVAKRICKEADNMQKLME